MYLQLYHGSTSKIKVVKKPPKQASKKSLNGQAKGIKTHMETAMKKSLNVQAKGINNKSQVGAIQNQE